MEKLMAVIVFAFVMLLLWITATHACQHTTVCFPDGCRVVTDCGSVVIVGE